MQDPRTDSGSQIQGAGRLTNFFAVLIALSLVGLFAWISAISPLNGEDYALTIRPNLMDLVERLAWIVERSSIQIDAWNARLGEQLAIFWLIQPRSWFAAANTLVFVAFCALLAGLAVGSMKLNSRFLRAWLTACALCFIFWPRLEIFFWTTTAAGYLHPLTLTLAFIFPYRLPELRQKLQQSRSGLLVWGMAGLGPASRSRMFRHS